jgi:hypothetical protein
MKATLRPKLSRISKVAFRLLASALAAASSGGSLRLPLSTSTNSVMLAVVAYEIASHRLALASTENPRACR